jgi:hypothetical protein
MQAMPPQTHRTALAVARRFVDDMRASPVPVGNLLANCLCVGAVVLLPLDVGLT